jgi:hypothetical protein
MIENNIDVAIINGWWIVPVRKDHPYRSKIQHLFALKDSYKKKDAMCYSLTKVMMNGYYGKLANLNAGYVEALPGDVADKYGEKAEYKAGRGWNPFYSSVITANTRLAVCRAQQFLGKDCLATHTDSVLSLRELPPEMLSEKLGGLAFKAHGKGLLLLCGLYDFAGRTAVRGFEKDSKSFNWRRILKEHPNASHYQFPQLRVVSWTQAVAWGTEEETNQFQYLNKKIDINADAKRIWDTEVTKGKHLLAGLEESEQRSVIHTQKIWGKQ